jgi:hypothetical protein
MEPVSQVLLTAMATGRSPAERSAWSTLDRLVRQPLGRVAGDHVPPVSTGESEFAALAREPGDVAAASQLSLVLALRALVDQDFRHRLSQWESDARAAQAAGSVSNAIDGTVYGGAIMGRDQVITIHQPGPPAATGPGRQEAEADRLRAAHRAAYSRLLGKLPRPDFQAVGWVKIPTPGKRLSRFLDGPECEPAEPAYYSSDVNSLVISVSHMRQPDELENPMAKFEREEAMRQGRSLGPGPTPEQLARHVASVRFRRAERRHLDVFPPPAHHSTDLYATGPADAYLDTLRDSLNSYLVERDGG